MTSLKLIKHASGAPGLRWLGLGPHLIPKRGLFELKRLLDTHAFWAQNRSYKNLRKLLAKSTVVVSIWDGQRMVGFGRAISDGVYRGVLWDVVVAGDLQGQGLGRTVVEALVSSPSMKGIEKIYLMTTHQQEFYKQIGFKLCADQDLLIKVNKAKSF
ncbi:MULTISPECIES: GNAT family N-acetyltransferase [Prochlorococcus]|uniref:GNAT family N-acetyltransferase n=1 Tax=Prochlorococcus TaxID=1218 RepID=UPI00053375F1|nr:MULTISPECIES: GNAT family N-acetyltransferase [Prochlorococcus]KGG13670.1 putative acetyltransferase [Prochlorococcus sp. MIT 0601]